MDYDYSNVQKAAIQLCQHLNPGKTCHIGSDHLCECFTHMEAAVNLVGGALLADDDKSVKDQLEQDFRDADLVYIDDSDDDNPNEFDVSTPENIGDMLQTYAHAGVPIQQIHFAIKINTAYAFLIEDNDPESSGAHIVMAPTYEEVSEAYDNLQQSAESKDSENPDDTEDDSDKPVNLNS